MLTETARIKSTGTSACVLLDGLEQTANQVSIHWKLNFQRVWPHPDWNLFFCVWAFATRFSQKFFDRPLYHDLVSLSLSWIFSYSIPFPNLCVFPTIVFVTSASVCKATNPAMHFCGIDHVCYLSFCSAEYNTSAWLVFRYWRVCLKSLHQWRLCRRNQYLDLQM